MTTLSEDDPCRLALAWLDVDPDPETRDETKRLLDTGGSALAAEFSSTLGFGTAGLRGRLGAGPARMNRVLVRVVAASLADRLLVDDDVPHVIIGFDARHNSRHFAYDTARVLAARGVRSTVIPETVPTPVVAFAVAHQRASAGVMVTASHNPRTDNGYKVYWHGGAQIVTPIDAEISARIAQTPLLGEDDLAEIDDSAIDIAGRSLADAYIGAIVGLLRPDGPRGARVAYTPLHGVGRDPLCRAFEIAGFAAPAVVAGQAIPDGDFPTTPLPNPEESGVLEPLLALASETGATVALANDPDADRLAVAVPNGPTWKLLTGDEVGAVLAEHLLSRQAEGARLVINTVASSRLLGKIAAHHGATYVECLTGFKWIMQSRHALPDHEFVMGYEEALGYTAGDVVPDKDGVATALVVAELVSELASKGRTVLDLLDDLHKLHGVHLTGQRSLKVGAATPSVMSVLRAHPPATLAGLDVIVCRDLLQGGDLPPTDALIFELDDARLMVRPSGTEPKVKVYAEVMRRPTDDLEAARADARQLLGRLLHDLMGVVADPDRRVVEVASSAQSAGDSAEPAEKLFAGTWGGVERAEALRLVVQCTDLTTLEGDDTPGRVRALCAMAGRADPGDPTVGPTAAVCVHPAFVPVALESLSGTGVTVAVAAGGFPTGLSPLDVRVAEIEQSMALGAQELDVVINRSAILSGRTDVATAELRRFRQAAGAATMKVVLEVSELGPASLIGTAAELAIGAGADFITTSSGKAAGGATPIAALAMAECIASHHEKTGEKVGLKVVGGVRSAADALGYIAMVRHLLGDEWLGPNWLRFGASSLLQDLVIEDLGRTEGAFR